MKWFSRLPVLVRVILYLGACEFLVFLSQLITGFFSFRGPVSINLLLCTLLLVTTSVILRIEGLRWADAGMKAGSSEFRRLLIGVPTGMAMVFITAWIIQLMTGFQWALNPAFSWWQLPGIFVAVFCSAFAQELAFRGYPFFLLLRKWGEWPAQLVIAFFFGCMHLHEGMSWQAVLMAMFNTGIGSLLFGMATIRTGTVILASGIHFGWNFLQYLLPRSPGENGKGPWLVTGGHTQHMSMAVYTVPYIAVIALVYIMLRTVPGKEQKL